MRKYFKYLSSLALIPFIQWYLKKQRRYSYKDIRISVEPGVFHPGFFYSTKFILSFLTEQKLSGKTFLELGCGSGLISIYAAKQHAIVTASDISSLAVKNCQANVTENNVVVTSMVSDLFVNVPLQVFDWVVINPPYYAKDPVKESDYAWYCGKEFEYFKKLFQTLSTYTDERSTIIMVLTKGCDLASIYSIAEKCGYTLTLLKEKKVLFDGLDFLFKIEKSKTRA